MPLIYQPSTKIEKRYDYCIINHLLNKKKVYTAENSILLTTVTRDYQQFINTILSSKLVISSSLHGIILAESNGVPAIFFCDNMEATLYKFYDYYYGTERYSVTIARSIEETLTLKPMPLPDFTQMRENLLSSFS